VIRSRFFKRGKESGAFPSFHDGRAHQGAAVGATSTSGFKERSFNPEHYVIKMDENVTVTTLTNDSAFNMKRFVCGIDDDTNNTLSRIDSTQERKNWYNQKKNQPYMPLKDNGSSFSALVGSSCNKKITTRVPSLQQLGRKCMSTKKMFGKYFADKSPSWGWRGKGRRKRDIGGSFTAPAAGYSSVGSRSRTSSLESLQKDDNCYGALSSFCLNYCDESGEREEKALWNK